MARTVWRYICPVTDDDVEFDLPRGARIVHVGTKGATPEVRSRRVMFWVEVDPGHPKESRYFRVFGTGHPIPVLENGMHKYQHLGTVVNDLDDGDALVWHLYEKVT